MAGSKEVIRPESFELFLAKKHRAAAFDLFDTDSSGDVTLDEVQRVAKHYLRERRNLRLSVKDHRTIVNKLAKVRAHTLSPSRATGVFAPAPKFSLICCV